MSLDAFRTAIQSEIAALPRRYPYSVSIAAPTDAADLRALAADHVGSDLDAWWEPFLAGLRIEDWSAILVMARQRTGARQALGVIVMEIGPISDTELQGQLTAWAVTRSLAITEQQRVLMALLVPVMRALVGMRARTMITSNVPTAALREMTLFTRLAALDGSRVVSQRLTRSDAEDARTLVYSLATTLLVIEAAI